MKIKTILKKLREERGLTQLEIATQAKIVERSYQRYETGERIPDVHTAQRIAKALNIDNVNKIFPLPEESASKE